MSALIDMYDDAIYKLSQENAKLREALMIISNIEFTTVEDYDTLYETIKEALAKDKQ